MSRIPARPDTPLPARPDETCRHAVMGSLFEGTFPSEGRLEALMDRVEHRPAPEPIR